MSTTATNNVLLRSEISIRQSLFCITHGITLQGEPIDEVVLVDDGKTRDIHLDQNRRVFTARHQPNQKVEVYYVASARAPEYLGSCDEIRLKKEGVMGTFRIFDGTIIWEYGNLTIGKERVDPPKRRVTVCISNFKSECPNYFRDFSARQGNMQSGFAEAYATWFTETMGFTKLQLLTWWNWMETQQVAPRINPISVCCEAVRWVRMQPCSPLDLESALYLLDQKIKYGGEVGENDEFVNIALTSLGLEPFRRLYAGEARALLFTARHLLNEVGLPKARPLSRNRND